MEKAAKSTYFLGATIVGSHALGRVRKYAERVGGEMKGEMHLTVLPPFMATYEEASDINLGCMSASILSTHPMNTTIFEMHGLDLMEFGGEEFLHFPITAYVTGSEAWEAYVRRIRQKLVERGISFKHKIPDEYRPHITTFAGKNISQDRSIRALIRESKSESAIRFNATYLTLYAKYKSGWGTLSHNPAWE